MTYSANIAAHPMSLRGAKRRGNLNWDKNGKETKKMQKKIFGGKIKIADLVLVAALLLVTLSVFLILEFTKKPGAYVRVSIKGETVAEYPLDREGEYSLNGGTNILVIENGSAYMKWADCPRQICVNDGKISRTGERIVCLENRVTLEVIGAEDEVLLLK